MNLSDPYRIFVPISSQIPLNKEAWDSVRKGLDYIEEAPEVIPEDLPTTAAATQEWIIVFRYLAVALLAILLVYLIVRLVLNRRGKKNNSESKAEESEIQVEEPTALSSMDQLREALNEAKRAANYREAVRLLYQIAVKYLHDAGKLEATPEKTAREYVREMSWKEKSEEFFRITLLHEYSWYGSSDITETDFILLEPKFNSFIDSLSNEK